MRKGGLTFNERKRHESPADSPSTTLLAFRQTIIKTFQCLQPTGDLQRAVMRQHLKHCKRRLASPRVTAGIHVPCYWPRLLRPFWLTRLHQDLTAGTIKKKISRTQPGIPRKLQPR